MVLVGLIGAIEVDAEGDGHVGILGDSGDDHLLGPGAEVLGGVIARGEESGRLDHHLNSHLSPGQSGGIALGEDLDLSPINHDRAVQRLYRPREAAQDRVVLEQVGEGLRVGQVVDRDELQLGPRRPCRAENVSPDPPETVDADLDSHQVKPSWNS